MSMLDMLPHTTSRIETQSPSGSSIGTGFFFIIEVEGKGSMPILVTNKHVVENATEATICFTKKSGDGPAFGQFKRWTTDNFQDGVVEHPDPNIDLAAFPISHILHAMESEGTPAFFLPFDQSLIPTEKQIEGFTAIEEITMIGYPTGIWDQSNNLPIVRKGITATPYSRDYNGRAEFMIDCACFPGSSGSPVVIANHGSFPLKDGGIAMGSRLHLLGLLWGGPQFTAQGQIVAVPVPTAATPIALSQIPTNLGFCIKSKAILDLVPLFEAKFG